MIFLLSKFVKKKNIVVKLVSINYCIVYLFKNKENFFVFNI